VHICNTTKNQGFPEETISDSLIVLVVAFGYILLTARYACLSIPCHALVDLRVDFSRR
jgi:hypothetical protein